MNWYDIQFAQDRHEEFLRQAELQHRIAQAKSEAKAPQPILRKASEAQPRPAQPPLRPANKRT